MNSQSRILIVVIVILLIATGMWFIWNSEKSNTDTSIDTYQKGEDIEIKINDNVEICTNQLPFSILDPKDKPIQLKHSCVGLLGSGIDQYCENGKKIIKDIDILCSFSEKWCRGCSDAIFCRKQTVRENFLWDQNEYITLTEKCEGQTISRQEKIQVPAGKYKIVVGEEIIKEIIIK